MDFSKLGALSKKPPLYEKGDSVMWTDEYISEQLLEMHLNPEIDLASRTKQSIENTIEFIVKFCNKSDLKILDLGCGPGLYAERLAGLGHKVTGVDFSESSIKHALNQAKIKRLSIDYICKDYLTIDYKNEFDIILLIYTDFGVLIPADRERLLTNIHHALKPNGIFIFDVINMKNQEQKFQEYKSWKYENSGFWKDTPYLELTNGFNYSNDRVFLRQHIIIDQTENIKTYRFWTHYFENNDIIKILKSKGFTNIESFDNILPDTHIWNGDNITFYKAIKHMD